MQIPIFVISLSESKDRRDKMAEKLAALNLDFVFFDAVDGREFDVADHPAYCASKRRRAFGRDLTGGELGCLLSHKALYQKIANEEIPCALILEDDVILDTEFPNILNALIAMPVSFDVIRFLGSPKVAALKQRQVYPLTQTYFLSRLSTTPGGAHATLVTKLGAQKLLNHMDKNWLPVDTLLGRSWMTGVEWFTVQPGLAIQDLSLDSAIGEERFDKTIDLHGVQKFLFPLTRAFFKFEEAIGKKWHYESSRFRDRKNATRLRKS